MVSFANPHSFMNSILKLLSSKHTSSDDIRSQAVDLQTHECHKHLAEIIIMSQVRFT